MIIEAREDTITLKGNMPKNIWPAIQAAAALLLEDHPAGIIIDASGLDKVTPEGGETFIDASDYIYSHNARIVVTGVSEEVLEIITQVPGVRSQLPMADSIEDARASLALEETTIHRGKARIAGLVPLVGNWQRAIYHAERLAIGENCEIHLLELMKIPRNLPIGTPLPDKETSGQYRLDSAVEMVKKDKVSGFGHIERIRSYRDGTAAFAKELEADFVVLSIDQKEGDEPFIEEFKGLDMLQAADYELSIIKSGTTINNTTPNQVVVPAVGEWRHALEHACKLVSNTQAGVTLVCLITIPRSEPLDVPRPDIDEMVKSYNREALQIGKRYGVKVENKVERVRQPSIAFMKMLEPLGTELVVVGLGSKSDIDNSTAISISDELMRNTYCETVFLKAIV